MKINLKKQGGMFCLILVVVLVPSLRSQTIEYGKLTGTVVDELGTSLPGVTVEASSPVLMGGKRATQTSARGTYIFINLPPGKYDLTASLSGFKTSKQEDIIITAGSSLVVNIRMEMGKLEETVTVTAAGPVVDAKTSTVSTNIQSELLAKLPTSRDAFYDLALTTPGMVAQGKDGSSLPSPNAYGGASNENVFLINGVNTTNPRSAAYGSLVNVNYNAVEEVRVIALGSRAEYGSYSGVAIDVLTRSGSNDFHGNFSVYGAPKDWVADNQPRPATSGESVDMGIFGPYGERLYIGPGDDILNKTTKQYEFNLTAGGPIKKDKVWFYGGIDYIRSNSKQPFWEVPNRYWGRLADIKITTEPWTNHRAWIAYHYEKNKGDGWTWDPHWDPTMTYGQNSQTNSISAQWQWMASGKTVFTVKWLGFWRNDEPFIPEDAPEKPGYINWWKWAAYGINGSMPNVEAQKSSRNTIQADVSYYAEHFLGEHDIKFGIQYTFGRGDWMGGYFHNYANFAYPLPWTNKISELIYTYGATGLVFYNRQVRLNPFLTVRTANQAGVFFDDQWTPVKRLTVNLGLRFDRMTTKYGKGKVYEYASTPEEINSPPPVLRDRQGTGNIFDFKNFSPRIGLTWAITGDMKTIFRASYGRYYLPLSVEYLRRFGPDMPLANIHYQFYNIPFELFNLDGDDYISADETIAAARYIGDSTEDPDAGPPWMVDTTQDYSWQLKVKEGTKDQHTDQITLNLEREIVRDLSFSATYIWKKTSNIFVNWPLNRETQEPFEYEEKEYTTEYGRTVTLYSIVMKDYDGDGDKDGADIGWIGTHTDYMVRNMPMVDGIKPKRSYQGLQFMLNKRYSNRWQLMASAVFSRSDGFAMRPVRQDFNFEGPMVMDTTFISSRNQVVNNMEGPLPHTQKFEFKLSGSYRIPVIETDLGWRIRYNSGRPVWPLESYRVIDQWSYPEGLVINTGDNYIVSIDPKKPWYLPHETVVDLRLDRAFSLKNAGQIRLAVDILNLFNEHAVTNAGYGSAIEPDIGRVSGITYPSRMIRLSFSYEY
ncbi:MAG: TonB-dependent receptor [Acidobacteriota bacterium]|nr:TonB-dependent receptor [Acidobacteriota bacterium]